MIQRRAWSVKGDMYGAEQIAGATRDSRQRRARGLLVTVDHQAPPGARPGARTLDGLVRRIAAGQDREAFAQLFRHFAPRIKTFMIRAGMPAASAEELAQETMLTVWRKAAAFDPEVAGASTWIFTIARNLRIDHLRRARDRGAQGDSAAEAEEEADTAPDGEAALFVTERDGILRGALETLSREQAQVLQLSFFSDIPHVEIAARLGIPLGTVKSRVRLALQRLRHALGDRL